MKLISILIKSVVILIIMAVGYYLFFIRPSFIKRQELIKTEVSLSKCYFNLIQNKTAYITLVKLNSSEANFGWDKSNLVGLLKESNKNGRDLCKDQKIKDFFQKQSGLFDKVFTTKTFSEGIVILKSNDSIDLLTEESNLASQLEFQIEQIQSQIAKH